MSLRLILPAVAVLAFAAAPALAQDAMAPAPAAPATAAQATPAPQAAPAPEADEPMSAAEQAVEDAGKTFEADITAMVEELKAAKIAAGADTAKADADADAIVAKYQPKADAFADQLAAFLATPEAGVPADKMEEATQAIQSIRTVPTQVRTGVMSAPAEAAAPAAPAPATPQ